MNDPEIIGEQIAATIENAVADVQADAEHADELNKQLIEASIEGERSRRMSELERRFDEWQSNQNETAEAIAALTLGLTDLSGKVSALLTLQQPPMPNPPSEEAAGPPESQEEIPVHVEATAKVEEPPPPPAPPKKRRRSWI